MIGYKHKGRGLGRAEIIKIKKEANNSYHEACKITQNEESGGEHKAGGVVFSSGYGDGCYPVTAHYNNDGRIVKIEIEME